MKKSGRIPAEPYTQESEDNANKNAERIWPSEPQNSDGDGIAEPNASANKERGCGAHPGSPTPRRTASKTESTSIASMEGSGASPRLWVVIESRARRTIVSPVVVSGRASR